LYIDLFVYRYVITSSLLASDTTPSWPRLCSFCLSWRTFEIAIPTLMIYLPDSLSLRFLAKAAGLTMKFGDTLVLVGMASLSSLVALQFAYTPAIGFADGPLAVGIATATLAQLWLLLPVTLVATGILTHGSGRLPASPLKGRSSETTKVRPKANGAVWP